MMLMVLSQQGEGEWNPFAKVGIAGSKFLQLHTSPKVAAMGGAGVTLFGDDPLLMINNPASAMFATNKAVGVGFMPYWVSTYVSDIAYLHPLGRFKLGGYIHGVTSTGFEEVRLNEETYMYEKTGKTFNYTAMALAFVAGARLTDRFSVALAPKFIYEGFGSYTSTWAVAVDVGTVFETGWRGVNLGMSVQNFGTDPTLKGSYIRYSFQGGQVVQDTIPYKSYNLPLTFKAGLSMDIFRNSYNAVVAVVEANHHTDNAESYNLGFQYSYSDMFFLRFGKRFFGGFSWVPESHDEVFGLGFGVKFAGFSFDYSYTVNYRMPDLNRFSLVYRF